MLELSPVLITILMFGGLLVGLFMGHPLAFILGGLSVIFGFLSWGPSMFHIFANRIMGVMDNLILAAIPLFIFMANLLQESGVADNLFESLRYLLGPIRGGVAMAVVVVCTVFAACTGVIGASVVTMALLAMPMMLRYGYDKSLTCGTICAGGTLGILIPPSIMLVLMGDQTGLSVGKLFLGGLVPGVVLSILYIGYIAIVCGRNPEKGPPLSPEERAAVPVPKRISMAAVNLVPPALLIIGVLGAIFSGIATPTEASGVGAFLAFLMTFVYRRFSWRMLKAVILSTGRTVSMVMIILVGASCFTGVFLGLGGKEVLPRKVVWRIVIIDIAIAVTELLHEARWGIAQMQGDGKCASPLDFRTQPSLGHVKSIALRRCGQVNDALQKREFALGRAQGFVGFTRCQRHDERLRISIAHIF